MDSPKFQMYLGKNEQFYFRLIAKNGQNVLSSEGYSSKAACKGGIESVKKNAPQDERYECKEVKGGKFHFILAAPNGKVIGSSQVYASAETCKKGIAAVKRAAAEAGVEDATG
ncbi:MAG: YegP family protein [Anaerolineae bacterium]|nr:YegP family protein [Anaerolineae bacterium]